MKASELVVGKLYAYTTKRPTRYNQLHHIRAEKVELVDAALEYRDIRGRAVKGDDRTFYGTDEPTRSALNFYPKNRILVRLVAMRNRTRQYLAVLPQHLPDDWDRWEGKREESSDASVKQERALRKKDDDERKLLARLTRRLKKLGFDEAELREYHGDVRVDVVILSGLLDLAEKGAGQ